MYDPPALLQFCEEQMEAQRQKMLDAQKVVTIYATADVSGAVIGPDREEAAMRGTHQWPTSAPAPRVRSKIAAVVLPPPKRSNPTP